MMGNKCPELRIKATPYVLVSTYFNPAQLLKLLNH